MFLKLIYVTFYEEKIVSVICKFYIAKFCRIIEMIFLALI